MTPGLPSQLSLDIGLPDSATFNTLRKSPPTGSVDEGIFGWYRYIQNFSGDFATEWLTKLGNTGDTVWDPFSGSGTTLVAAKQLNLKSVGYDINPFMVDVARAKVDWSIDLGSLTRSLQKVGDKVAPISKDEPPRVIRCTWSEYEKSILKSAVNYPSDAKLRKWVSPIVLSRIRSLVSAVDTLVELRQRRFMRLAVASILIPASNMTFRPNICYERHPIQDFPVIREFTNRVEQMLRDYERVHNQSKTSARVFLGDARTDGCKQADLIFTSPPYPNDMEYVHQTRLELALLQYVENSDELTALKKRMISSSVKLVYRVNDWQKTQGLQIPGVLSIYNPIVKTLEGRGWGWNPADMTAQYFGGMRTVIKNWFARLAHGGVAAIVVGDSAFNGIKVPTDILLGETAEAEGFVVKDISVFRSRWNSKHKIELRESVLLLKKR